MAPATTCEDSGGADGADISAASCDALLVDARKVQC